MDTTKGKLPHGKEPAEPFKDEVDKMEKVNRKKRKIPPWKDYVDREKRKYPSWMDHKIIEDIARAKHHFLYSNRPDPYGKILDEISIAKHDKEVASILARFDPEKEPEPFKEVDTKQMKNKKLSRWADPKTYEAIRLSNGKHPVMYDKLIEPVESDDSDRPVDSDDYYKPFESDDSDEPVESDDSDEPVESDDSDEPVESIPDEKTIAKHNTQVAGALDRSEREKELELYKEVDKMQKVDSTKGKIPSGKKPRAI